MSRLFWRLAGTVGAVLLAFPAAGLAQNPPVAVQLPTGDYLIATRPTDSLPPQLMGEFHLIIEPGGSYRVVRNGTAVVIGEYRAVGDTLLLIDKSGAMACADEGAPATYLWKTGADGSLTLVRVQDPCTGRARMTTLRAMLKAKPN